MQLILDIGNSAIKGGFYEQGLVTEPFRIHLAVSDPTGVWETTLHPFLAARHIDQVGIASVVPTMTARLQTFFSNRKVPVEIVHHRMHLPFTLAYETPQTMGTDRLAAAAAAWIRYGRADPGRPRAIVALDAGTACTCEVIDSAGVYRGGYISPGPALSQKALNQGTAQLPAVPLELPFSPIGRSTTEALQSGIMHTFIGGVRELLTHIRKDLGEQPLVVATGGWSPLLADHVSIHHLDPHLVLYGIAWLMELQKAD